MYGNHLVEWSRTSLSNFDKGHDNETVLRLGETLKHFQAFS